MANESAAKARSGVWGGNNQDLHKDVMGPAGSDNGTRATAWLRSSLHVKGEISGNEDLCALTEQLKAWSISMTAGAEGKTVNTASLRLQEKGIFLALSTCSQESP